MFDVLAKRALRSMLPLAAAAITVAAPFAANAQTPELATSVWCDKAEQVESVVRTHLADGLALQAAVERTNAAAETPDACVAATAVVVETGETRRFVAGNQLMETSQFLVIGVVKDGRVLQIEPVMWYAAKIVAKLAAI